jgi:DNA-binding NarL/FixJ family response regulator
VVDDFEPWRRYVSSTLRKEPGWQVVGEASDGLEAFQKAVELEPDLILLDIGLPTLNGIEAARRIREIVPEAKIIFLSEESSPVTVQEAMSLGARGYVVKTMVAIDLVTAVETVLAGMKFVSI